ncbi:hypothetical protein VTN77DRAFT_9616 [Rasamsonia byssochlamydoides]|uniref:uncharacterized protein n=1 Tax=Rasamsonia byssochlamydoides TaxID=89139 RepID=UPI003744A063
MCLPAPSIVSINTKQALLAAWQVFPVYISVLARICSFFSSHIFHASEKSGLATLHGLRRIYAFAFACAVLPRIAAWALSLTSLAFPTRFSESVAAGLHPMRVFVNTLPWLSPSIQATSVGEGAPLVSPVGRSDWFDNAAPLDYSTVQSGPSGGMDRGKVDRIRIEDRLTLRDFWTGGGGSSIDVERDELVFEKLVDENDQDRKTR